MPPRADLRVKPPETAGGREASEDQKWNNCHPICLCDVEEHIGGQAGPHEEQAADKHLLLPTLRGQLDGNRLNDTLDDDHAHGLTGRGGRVIIFGEIEAIARS